MMLLIVGRSGSGKDYLRNILTDMGLTAVLSRTTRPRRSADEDTHIFLTEEEASEQLPFAVAKTEINGYSYFATAEDVETNDIYIVDPKGVDDLTHALPNTEFRIVYVYATRENRERMATQRAEDPEAEREVFHSRDADEDEQFAQFEDMVAKGMNGETPFTPNVYALDFLPNDYQPETLQNEAVTLFEEMLYHKNLETILSELIEEEIIPTFEGRVLIDDNGVVSEMSIDHAASSLVANESNAHDIIHYYLRHFRLPM